MLLFDSLKTNSENYSNTFYLVTLNEEIDCGRKDRGKKECKFNNQYRIICGIEECEFVVYLRNCWIRIYSKFEENNIETKAKTYDQVTNFKKLMSHFTWKTRI